MNSMTISVRGELLQELVVEGGKTIDQRTERCLRRIKKLEIQAEAERDYVQNGYQSPARALLEEKIVHENILRQQRIYAWLGTAISDDTSGTFQVTIADVERISSGQLCIVRSVRDVQ